MRPDRAVCQLLDINGDGTGSSDANVNGSVTPVVFKYVCPAGKKAHLTQLRIHIADNTTVSADTYGGLSALTNGMSLGIYDSGDNLILDLFAEHPIKNNNDWASISDALQVINFGTPVENAISIHIHFSEDFSDELVLEAGEYIAMTVNDDLTGLVDHHFDLRGRLMP